MHKQQITVLKMASVQQPQIVHALQEEGVEWQQALHITTTTSLRRTIIETDGFALLMQQFIDLIITPTIPNRDQRTNHHKPFLFPITEFPHRNDANFADRHRDWINHITSYRMQFALRFNNLLRRQLRIANSTIESDIARTIYESRQTFLKSIQNLIGSGITPDEINTDDPVVQLATRIWRTIEAHESLADITQIRTDLWIDPLEFQEQYTPRSQSLRQRIEQALARLFVNNTEPRTIVYHGFFYYNPPQWALFHLLKHSPNLRQIFIVHDDGQNPAFESWRKYYDARWLMPPAKIVATSHTPTPAADALTKAFQGAHIDASQLNAHLNLLECGTPAEFVMHINQHAALINTAHPPKLYAADASTMNRYVERLGISSQHALIDLSKLPIGSFLIRIHECIPTHKREHVQFTVAGIHDIIASGYLLIEGNPCQQLAHIWQQVSPFFAGCTTADSWKNRARVLHKQLHNIALQNPPKDTTDDFTRINDAAFNLYRLAPWADITVEQARLIRRIIYEIDRLVNSIADKEQVQLEKHFSFLRRELASAMRHTPPEKRAEIEAKLTGIGMQPDQEVFVDELIDVVHMILGRTIPVDATGEDIEPEYPNIVAGIRSVDTLAMQPTPTAIHIANLADGSFPTNHTAIGWPFSINDISNHAEMLSMQLQKTRVQYAQLGDLYLLWVALDGVINQPITLSWISNIAGDLYNRSALLELLALPAKRHGIQHIAQQIGGLSTQKTQPPYFGDELLFPPKPHHIRYKHSDDSVWQHIHPYAKAAHVICHRRFVLQWALGPHIGFGTSHTQTMLYGNLIGASELPTSDIEETIVTNLWDFLTEGERASCRNEKRVGISGADPAWLHILAGSKHDSTMQSLAYKTALGTYKQPLNRNAPDTFIPDGQLQHAKHNCERCPVRLRCAVALDLS